MTPSDRKRLGSSVKPPLIYLSNKFWCWARPKERNSQLSLNIPARHHYNPLILKKRVILKDLLSETQLKFSGEVIHPDNLLGKDSGAVQFLEIIRLTIETNVFILIYLVSLFFLLVWLLLHCLVKMPNSHFSSITDFFNCLLITIFKRDPYLIPGLTLA